VPRSLRLEASVLDTITTRAPFHLERTHFHAFSRLLKNGSPTDFREVTREGAFRRAPALITSREETGGADRIRTDDPLLAKQMLSQLSYSPASGLTDCTRTGLHHAHELVGLVGVEPTTPRLSSVCSNQLSYRPVRFVSWQLSLPWPSTLYMSTKP
jgi:hypothetical protein